MNNNKGFTLLETLVAVLLISLALVTFLSTASSGIRSTSQAVDQMIAQSLAQEGVELVIATRNSNFLNTPATTWDSGLLSCGTGCTIEPWPTLTLDNQCATRACATLYVTPSGKYTHTNLPGYKKTPFSRFVIITPDPATGGLIVVSQVQWDDKQIVRQVQVTSFLTNWFQSLPVVNPNPQGIPENQ